MTVITRKDFKTSHLKKEGKKLQSLEIELLNSGLQNKDNALYQTILGIINKVDQSQLLTESAEEALTLNVNELATAVGKDVRIINDNPNIQFHPFLFVGS